ERFASVRLTAIYSSPLDRCTQTVEPLATAKRLRVSLAPDLIEMDTGAWTGRTLPQVRRTKLWRVVQTEPSQFRFPGGEGFVEAETRAAAGGSCEDNHRGARSRGSDHRGCGRRAGDADLLPTGPRRRRARHRGRREGAGGAPFAIRPRAARRGAARDGAAR